MTTPPLNHNRLTLVPLIKSSNHPGLARLEQLLLFGTLCKLALGSNISVKNLATLANTANAAPNPGHFSDPTAYQAHLLQTAHRLGSRFVLSGSVTTPDEPDQLLETVSLTLRLFDAEERDMTAEERLELDELRDTGPDTHGLALSPDQLNRLVGRTAQWLAGIILPEIDFETLENLALTPLTTSVTAIEHLIEAEQGNLEASERIERYEAALKLDPSLELAYVNLAKLNKASGDFRKSVHHYRRALEVSQGNTRAKALYANEAGICCALMGETAPALSWWEQSIRLEPTYLNPYMSIAHHHEEQQDLLEAERFFLRAQHAVPHDPRSYYSLARVYSKLNQWEDALEQYKHQLRTDENDPWCHCNIATCYLQMGDTHNAMTHFQTAVALAPESEAAHYAQLIIGTLAAV